MPLSAAIACCLLNAFNFEGRAGRREFWWFALFYALAMIAMLTALGFGSVAASLVTAVGFYLTTALFAAGARRLHDIDRPGRAAWIALVPLAGPVLLGELLIRPGTVGPNGYADDPRYGWWDRDA